MHTVSVTSEILPALQERTSAIVSLAALRIHALLMRPASGFYRLDTTRVFRAYSSRLLSDSIVAILRDCLRESELLPAYPA